MSQTSQKKMKIKKVVRPSRQEATKAIAEHTCAGEGCNVRIFYARDRKYCSQKCRKIAAQNHTVAERSSQYKPEYATCVDKWLKQFKGVRYERHPTGEVEEYEDKNGRKRKKKVYKTVSVGDIPTVEQFARHLGFTRQTLYAWEKRYPALAEALQKIQDHKKDLIQRYGISGHYNSRVVALNLMSDHGMKERSESDNKHAVLGIVKQAYEEADRMEKEYLENKNKDV